MNIIRQITLDTETTGINKSGLHYEGHRIIEIGAIEIVNRRLTGKHFHVYLNPNRRIDPEAFDIHGISNEFLSDQPTFSEIFDEFLEFISGSELIIHNAPFDIGFINYEISMLNRPIKKIESYCTITDSLKLARKIFPGKRNNLDVLCERYMINNNKRTLHGALLDAEILADIFLFMTSGQTVINFETEENIKLNNSNINDTTQIELTQNVQSSLKIIYANEKEILAHNSQLNSIQEKSGICLWRFLKYE